MSIEFLRGCSAIENLYIRKRMKELDYGITSIAGNAITTIIGQVWNRHFLTLLDLKSPLTGSGRKASEFG